MKKDNLISVCKDGKTYNVKINKKDNGKCSYLTTFTSYAEVAMFEQIRRIDDGISKMVD